MVSSSWIALVAVCACVATVSSDRAYPLGCSQQPPTYYNYDSYPFPPPGTLIGSTNDYLLLRRLGSGKFSDVFEAVDVRRDKALVINGMKTSEIDPRTLVVLKCLKPVSERKIRRELLVLSHASQLPNLVRLLGVVIPRIVSAPSSSDTDMKHPQPMPTLVLEHAGVKSQWLCHGRGFDLSSQPTSLSSHLSEYEIKYFLYHLLIALDALHSRGIMHRDVKPRNVLINRQSTTTDVPLMLIDLGLADFYLPHTRYNVRVASRHYKSPELLIGFEYYDYAIDLWGVGCILAGLLLRREPVFRGKDNLDQLAKIASVLGTDDLLAYMAKYQIELTPEIHLVVAKYVGRRKAWTALMADGCPPPSVDGLDLLDKLLKYDHQERWTAQQAMQHRFFDAVRERVHTEVRQRRAHV